MSAATPQEPLTTVSPALAHGISDLTLHARAEHVLLVPQCEGTPCEDRTQYERIFTTALRAKYNGAVYISRARLQLYSWFSQTMLRLDCGQLYGVGDCKAVVGARGTGKTFFLKALAETAMECVCNTMICWIDFQNVQPITKDIVEIFVELLSKEQPTVSFESIKTVDHMYGWLTKNNLFLVFIIDELERVFASADVCCHRIIGQLISLAKTQAQRRMCAIVTGSPARLPQLLFCHLSGDMKEKYPAYNVANNFNDRKYTVTMIQSLSWINDISEAKNCILSNKLSRSSFKKAEGGDDGVVSSGAMALASTGLHDTSRSDMKLAVMSRGGLGDKYVDINDLEDTVELLTLCRGNFQVLEYLVCGEADRLATTLSAWDAKKKDGFVPQLWRSMIQSLKSNAEVELTACVEAFTTRDPGIRPECPAVPLRILLEKFNLDCSPGALKYADPKDFRECLFDAYDAGFIFMQGCKETGYTVQFAHVVDLMYAYKAFLSPPDPGVEHGTSLSRPVATL